MEITHDENKVIYRLQEEDGEQVRRIVNSVLPGVMALFAQKNREYKENATTLGPRGQFADMWRKMGKLRTALWDGDEDALVTEGVDEILRDLVGHCLLTLLMREDDPSRGEQGETPISDAQSEPLHWPLSPEGEALRDAMIAAQERLREDLLPRTDLAPHGKHLQEAYQDALAPAADNNAPMRPEVLNRRARLQKITFDPLYPNREGQMYWEVFDSPEQPDDSDQPEPIDTIAKGDFVRVLKRDADVRIMEVVEIGERGVRTAGTRGWFNPVFLTKAGVYQPQKRSAEWSGQDETWRVRAVEPRTDDDAWYETLALGSKVRFAGTEHPTVYTIDGISHLGVYLDQYPTIVSPVLLELAGE